MDRDLLHGGDADDLQDFPQGGGQVQAARGDGDEQESAEGRPDLDSDAVERGAVKTAQSQVLLDPAKEQFDGPAAAVNLGDGKSVQVELIGQKRQGVACLCVGPGFMDTRQR